MPLPHVDRVIEERAVAIGSGLHSLQELRKQRNMVRIDLCYLRHLVRIVAVMTGRMVRVADADLRIGAIALLARELEGDDARDVRLKARICRSNMSFAWSANAAGTPTGRSRSGVLLSATACSARSISRST